jgi:hypothetical protein
VRLANQDIDVWKCAGSSSGLLDHLRVVVNADDQTVLADRGGQRGQVGTGSASDV